MKIIVLHGTDTEKSYSRLTKFITEAKKRGWDIVNDKIEDTPSLFGTEKLIIIRDYKLIGKNELNLIKKISGTLIVYTAGFHPAISLKALNADTVEKYELPILLWKFLDNMTIKGFHELLKTNAVEYIFAMIAWKLKQRYQTNPTPGVGQMISELAEIDVKSKTSKLDLKLALDLFILKRLS
ncbi:hypothetical protein A2130_02000 [Candidatus Woesebacteria bacterium GWC2_33_12]|uniref:Uncharacterized protein n=1 Tax=Candidatus Woesebacteria bacterium GW2011_GWB1_33_22 TaxID=1618566 RepID=A0A0G0C1F9_9BACT|nr:MAG: hypothetical protein UR29_C0003G0033 [Candidatus Woesebacteria bacterium GW2011_GWC2_33_12]KKP42274.1 MAG: hypothetical protein UR33_C0004G0033 [Candidatus Woesebacteria bacterium GW2011_GWA2_33_20]KKP45005.1 MAG: hypothetical protein UR35_C0004G0037 [Candidatus Woesebacteria bacterium GW2011_GWB1_33_22]KKP46854.1 MAG: hypothetical protein UR37_C0004G0033 [Microgenomates group bacterium GW2011_GWC1_33_28]KKP50726.1 MAG: hypothetical protein UR41_C0004G0037 [Candidatus Woesebacteria bact